MAVDGSQVAAPAGGDATSSGSTPAPESTSSPQSGERQNGGGWFDRALGRGRPAQRTDASNGTDSENGQTGTPAGPEERANTSSTDGLGSKTDEDNKIVLSQEELTRYVQAEADRREGKRLAAEKRANAQREKTTSETRQRDEQERLRKLADEDPYEYAEESKKKFAQDERASQDQRLLSSVVTDFDKNLLDPVLLSLPPDEQQKIAAALDGMDALEGRRFAIAEGLKTIRRLERARGAADADKKLRVNPAFRKEMLAQLRGDEEQPDLVVARPSTQPMDMNTLLRRARRGSA